MTALVLSGAEITDALRALGVQGDGLSADSSMGIWPAATNLITNGGFEIDTAGWTMQGPPVRSTEQAKFGTASLKMSAAGYWYAFVDFATTLAQVRVFSVWRKCVGLTSDAGAGVAIEGSGFTTTILPESAPSMRTGVIGDVQWERIAIKVTGTGAGTARLLLTNNYGGTAAAGSVYFDGAQYEDGPIATPYIETDGGTAARAAARVQVPVAGLFTPTQGWVAMRCRWGGNPANNSTFALSTGVDGLLQAFIGGTSGNWYIERQGAGGVGYVGPVWKSGAPLAIGALFTVIYHWTASAIGGSYNGGAFVDTASTAVPVFGATVEIGTYQDGTAQISSDILWFAAGSGTLTDADAATIHAFGNTDPIAAALPGTPTLVWPADTAGLSYIIGAASIISKGASYTPQISKGASYTPQISKGASFI